MKIEIKAADSCHVDRKLVSGASPRAANNFGKMAARALLDHVNKPSSNRGQESTSNDKV